MVKKLSFVLAALLLILVVVCSTAGCTSNNQPSYQVVYQTQAPQATAQVNANLISSTWTSNNYIEVVSQIYNNGNADAKNVMAHIFIRNDYGNVLATQNYYVGNLQAGTAQTITVTVYIPNGTGQGGTTVVTATQG